MLENYKKDFQKKNFEKKDELIEAAIIEFGQKSFDDASLNNILTEAGLSKGSFYYHFKNKQELYIYLILEVAEVKYQGDGSFDIQND